MPGFNVAGAGGSPGGPSNVSEVRRKHRWVFETLGRGPGDQFSSKELLVLQSASRPSFKFEQPEMHHNQEVIRFAGKQDWDPVTLVWYDSEQDPDLSAGVYRWLENVVNLEDLGVAHPSIYKQHATLIMIDGQGQYAGGAAGVTSTNFSERWIMYGTWPAEINWQELDYTSTDLMTIEATMRYDRARKQCPGNNATVTANYVSCPPNI